MSEDKAVFIVDSQREFDYLTYDCEVEDFDVRLYFTLRRHMNKENGLVGAPPNNICYATLARYMKVKRPWGSTKQERTSVSRSMLRASIERLEKIGAVVVKSVNKTDEKRLILELPLALTDRSIKKRNDRGTAETERPEKIIDNSGFEHIGTTEEQPRVNDRYHSNHIYKEKYNTSYYTKRNSEKPKKQTKPKATLTPLPENFNFDESHVAYAEKHGWPHPSHFIDRFREKALMKGWMYANWKMTFRNFMANDVKWDKERREQNEKRVTNYRPTAEKDSSLVSYFKKHNATRNFLSDGIDDIEPF